MKRASMQRHKKDLLSKVTRILNYSEYIHTNLFVIKRTCGNPNCNYIKEGKKHITKDGKRKIIYIPKRLEDKAREYTERYFKTRDAI